MRPTWWVALVLLVGAVVGIVVWFTAGGSQPWTPPIVVGAITSAVTITVIEEVVRHEERQRTKPRVDDVLFRIGSGLRALVFAIVVDYAGTHLHNFQEIPASVLELIDLWLSQAEAEDNGGSWHRCGHGESRIARLSWAFAG